jgi:alkylation response protein AidB-like acyl-CoA dehydrogenase
VATLNLIETVEQQEVRVAVRAIAADYSHEWYIERARAGQKVDELWDAIGESGFVGVNLPEEYGGGGAGLRELSIVAEELSAAGLPLLMLIVSPAICGTVLSRYGTGEQKERWLPGLSSGAIKMAFAITEPDAGTNSHNITMSAHRDGDDWMLKGTKYYCSGADEADALLVVARTGTDENSGRAHLSLFIVETPDPNLEMNLIPVEVIAPERQFTLFFDDVRLPSGALLGEVDDGLRQIFYGLNPERVMSAATANGIGRFGLERGAKYAKERQVWGSPIGTHQGLAHPLAESYIRVELARLMTSKAALM